MVIAPSIPKLETAAVGNPITRLGISFFPIYLGGNRLPQIATGEASGLVIDELDRAEVPTLSARNPTKTPILIVEGEHFLGGKQNRTINVTVLVPAVTKLEIPVTCLERERWGRARAYGRSETFTPARVRSLNQEAVYQSMNAFGSREGDQGAVWSAVDEVLGDLDTPSDTAAAADADAVYGRDGRRLEAAGELAGLGPLPDQCGVAVARGREVVAIELFGSQELLASHWSAMIRSHLLEPAKPSGRPSATAVLSVLKRFGSLVPEDSPGIGLGIEQRVRDRRIVGQALTFDESIVHCSAFTRSRQRATRPSEALARAS